MKSFLPFHPHSGKVWAVSMVLLASTSVTFSELFSIFPKTLVSLLFVTLALGQDHIPGVLRQNVVEGTWRT